MAEKKEEKKQLIPIVPKEELVKIPKKKEEQKTTTKHITRPITPITKIPKMAMVPAEKMKIAPTAKKIPTGPKPVIPTEDDCCAKVCTILNDAISDLDQGLVIRKEDLALQEMFLTTVKHRRRETVKIPSAVTISQMPGPVQLKERERRESGLKLRIGGRELKREIKVLERRLSTLKDFRYDLKEKGSCKCIADIPITPI